MSDVDKTKKLR